MENSDISNNIDAENRSTSDQPSPRPTHSIFHMALLHSAVGLGLLSMFAIADSWRLISALPLAGLFSVLSAVFAGALLTTLIHEWFHYLGVLICKGRYTHVSKTGLFVYNWDFKANSTRQFLTMSLAGTVGSFVAVALFATTVPTDSAGRAALQAAAWGSLAFTAAIEWPVLYRVYKGGEPLSELLRINKQVLRRSATSGVVAALIVWYLLL